MASVGLPLSIDFGTSNTAAVLRTRDGRVRSLLFDGAPLLPSAVFAPPDGALVVGRDALHHGRGTPAALERYPKRLVDDGHVLLGAREVPVVDAIAAVLTRVARAAEEVADGPLGTVTLTHPAGWGPARQLVLSDAAAAAGFGEVTLVPEPVAAAYYFTRVLGLDVPAGRALVVYDFGAGTCDVSVVRPDAEGLTILASDGLNVGGGDIDAALVEWLGARYAATHPEPWARLTRPRTDDDARHRLAMWDEVRAAKEMLSRAASAPLSVPLLGVDAPVTRGEFEAVAGPLVDRTVRATAALLRSAAVGTEEVAGLLLVGGSSRIPMVATALHRAVGVPATLTGQPELTVAEGGLHAAPTQPAPHTAPPAPRPAPRTAPQAAPTPGGARRRPVVLIVAGVAALLLLAATGLVFWTMGDGTLRGREPAPPAVTPVAGGSEGAPGQGNAAAGATGPGTPTRTLPAESATTKPSATRPGGPPAPPSSAPANGPPPSSPPPTIPMPDVTRMPEDKARGKLAELNYGLEVNATYINNPAQAPGVVDTSPPAGTPLQRGQAVILTVNKP